MAAPVEGEDMVAGGGEPRRDQIPRARVLEEAVQQEEERAAVSPFHQMMAQAVRDDVTRARGHRSESTTAVPAGGSMSTAVDSSNRATIM